MSSETLCSDVDSGGGNVYICTQSICDGDNGIETVVLRAGSNEIDGDGVPMFVRDWQEVQGANRFGGVAFIALTFST